MFRIWGCLLFFSTMTSCTLALADNASFAPKSLSVKDFADLKIPQQVKKDVLIQAVNKMRTRKDLAYVDLGDYTDFMHGHILFKKKDGVENFKIDGRLSEQDIDSSIWDSLEQVGILFHTQEYRGSRNQEGFVGKYGSLDPLNRSFLYLLKDNSYGKKGDLVDANLVGEFALKKKKRVKTVHPYHIAESTFGASFKHMSLAFYFFRIKCERRPNLTDSSVFKVQEDGVNTCLTFQSFYCRHNKCGDGEKVDHHTRFR